MKNILLKCGHSAMSIHEGAHDGLPAKHPSCVICAGLVGLDSCTPVEKDLTGRIARCDYYGKRGGRNYGPIYPEKSKCSPEKCLCEFASDIGHMPFFEYKPNEKFDRYFCGCYGWD